jgi:hypothetical protein
MFPGPLSEGRVRRLLRESQEGDALPSEAARVVMDFVLGHDRIRDALSEFPSCGRKGLAFNSALDKIMHSDL